MHKLTSYRKANGIKQREVAAAVGVSLGMVCNWEKGHRTPRLAHIRKIQEFTNGAVTADDFEPQDEGV